MYASTISSRSGSKTSQAAESRARAAYEQAGLPFCVGSPDDVKGPLALRRPTARADEHLVRRDKRLGVGAQLYPRRGQQDDVVADLLHVPKEMRRQQNGEASPGAAVASEARNSALAKGYKAATG